MIPIQFEYEFSMYKFDEDLGDYVFDNSRRFVVVLDIFKHHYTSEMMYHIRQDFIDSFGNPVSEKLVLREIEMLNLLSKRVTEE